MVCGELKPHIGLLYRAGLVRHKPLLSKGEDSREARI
jgi:hypothetical protein